MSCQEFCQAGAIGVVIEITAVEDGEVIELGDADNLKIFLEDPAGEVTGYDAVLSGDGSDGKFRYVTASADDLAAPGEWRAQGEFSLTGFVGRTAVKKFRVKTNLE